ncbi:hypothetical protein evm_012254 [Chilo suppressalis]|nr:hypothetical protein evm_012254 [Chilo suppressalis]
MPSADTKFFIWARGRWREVCLSTGRVQGVGAAPVRFLYVKEGRLVAARGSKVLRALRSHAENKPSSVHDGPPLPHRKRVKVRVRRSRSRRHRHCCCSSHGNQCNISLKEVAQNVHIQAATTPTTRSDAGVQASEPDKIVIETKIDSPVKSARSPVKATQTDTAQVAPQPRAKRKGSPVPEKPPKRRVSIASSIEDTRLERERSRCKELVIHEGDVDLYRTYLLIHDPDFDVYRFDTDDAFKMKLFYRINPLVSLSHCKQLERMLHERRVSQDSISLKDFATKLGLRSISDQENSNKRYKMRRRTAVQTIASSTSDDGADKENVVENKGKDGDLVNPPAGRTLRKMLMVEAVRRNISSATKSGASEDGSAVSKKKVPPVSNSEKCDAIVVSSSSEAKVVSSSSKEFAAQKPKFFTKKSAPKANPVRPTSQSSKTSGASNSRPADTRSLTSHNILRISFV